MMAEYLRTRGFQNPQQLTIKKIFAFYEMHKDIENREKMLDLELQITAISLFKTKTGYPKYKNLIIKLMENKI